MNELQQTQEVQVSGSGSRQLDPGELWLDQDIEPEQLVKLDPLEITDEIVRLAKFPELADPLIAFLPPKYRRGGRR